MVVATLVRLAVAFLAYLPGAGLSGAAAVATTDDTAVCGYDVPAIARCCGHDFDTTEASPTQLRGSLEGFASPPVEARGASTTPSAVVVATNSSDVLLNSSRQLQSKFKHAGDFGVTGNYSKANAAKYSEALNQHINSPAVTKISGTYRGDPVTHYLDPATGLNVIVDPSGVFVSGWKLGPQQLQNVLSHGGLT